MIQTPKNIFFPLSLIFINISIDKYPLFQDRFNAFLSDFPVYVFCFHQVLADHLPEDEILLPI